MAKQSRITAVQKFEARMGKSVTEVLESWGVTDYVEVQAEANDEWSFDVEKVNPDDVNADESDEEDLSSEESAASSEVEGARSSMDGRAGALGAEDALRGAALATGELGNGLVAKAKGADLNRIVRNRIRLTVHSRRAGSSEYLACGKLWQAGVHVECDTAGGPLWPLCKDCFVL